MYIVHLCTVQSVSPIGPSAAISQLRDSPCGFLA